MVFSTILPQIFFPSPETSDPTQSGEVPIESLSAARTLIAGLGSELRGNPLEATLGNLSNETDSFALHEALFHLARSLENGTHINSAERVYAYLAGSDFFENPAQVRLDAISGRGGLGQRLEFQLDRVVDQAMEPSSLFAMFGAGFSFRLARLGFRKLGFSAWAAGLGAFGLEATSFPIYARLGGQALGRRVDWGPQALTHDIASSFLVLGGLRAGGLLSRWGFGRVDGAIPMLGSSVGAASHVSTHGILFNQMGMLAGIMMGRGAEQFLGLSPSQSTGTFLTDSLVTLVQFNIAGRLIQIATPSSLQGIESQLDAQIRQWDSHGPAGRNWPLRLIPQYGFFAKSGSKRLPENSTTTFHPNENNLIPHQVFSMGGSRQSKLRSQTPADVHLWKSILRLSMLDPERPLTWEQVARSVDLEMGRNYSDWALLTKNLMNRAQRREVGWEETAEHLLGLMRANRISMQVMTQWVEDYRTRQSSGNPNAPAKDNPNQPLLNPVREAETANALEQAQRSHPSVLSSITLDLIQNRIDSLGYAIELRSADYLDHGKIAPATPRDKISDLPFRFFEVWDIKNHSQGLRLILKTADEGALAIAPEWVASFRPEDSTQAQRDFPRGAHAMFMVKSLDVPLGDWGRE